MPLTIYKCSLIRHLLQAAKSVIPRKWKTAVPPLLDEWFQVALIQRMEHLLAHSPASSRWYKDTWSQWLTFVRSTIISDRRMAASSHFIYDVQVLESRMKFYLTNCTTPSEFHLSVFPVPDGFQPVLVSGVLLMFLLTLLGNLIITGVVYVTSQLHTPMYYFLCNLSVEDIIYVCATLPKLVAITITVDTTIMFPDCIVQMFLFTFCVGTEFLLLTSMAYDRYVAICVPLRYTCIMNKDMCIRLLSVSWMVGLLNALMHAALVSNLSFCYSHNINHFYCDLKTMIALSSGDITGIEMLVSIECVFLGVIPFVMILMSYTCIITTIVTIRSSAGRVKAFSSCSSHLTIVILFYGVSLSSYMIPESVHSQEQDKVLSLIYTALVPMVNPLVYSLRNKQVLGAMDTIVERYNMSAYT
ncbi:olfactory receptor 2T11-like [Rhinoderma darwinii]|uniref:olfactory receptor 2T11-like n=1 Tax=Rhinoderma darwinii TaxID=43563 RepID=UPI003F681C18